mgnify:FL=1
MRFYRVLHHCSALTNGTRKGSGVRAVPQKLITYTLMKNILTIAIWVAVALAVIGGLWYLYDSISDVVSPNVGGAQSGLPTTVVLNPATTTSLTVNTTAALIFASSTCNSRIITTYASPIMIGLTDKFPFAPSGTSGVLQAASTTVAYDSGIYGCAAWRAYSFTAQNITAWQTE